MKLCSRKRFWIVGIILVIATIFNVTRLPQFQRERNLSGGSVISTHRFYGTHYVTVGLGQSSQSFRLAVSLGSNYTTFPCQNCDTCQEPRFHYEKGSARNCVETDCAFTDSICREDNEGRCEISVNFDDFCRKNKGGRCEGSLNVDEYSDNIEGTRLKGIEINDNVNIENIEDFSLDFICEEEKFGKAKQLGEGYLGMGTDESSFINQLFAANKIDKQMFSLCFRDFGTYHSSGASAGHVTFGHVERNLLDSPIVYATNYAKDESSVSYAVSLRRVFMARPRDGNPATILEDFSSGKIPALSVSSSETIKADYSHMDGKSGYLAIQTNQPITYLHSDIKDAFRSIFKEITGVDYNISFDLSEDTLQKLPTIFLQLESPTAEIFTDEIPGFVSYHHDKEHHLDVVIAIPPEHYLFFSDGKAYPMLHFGPYPALAANVFQNYEVIFDLARNKIGFAKRYKCPEGATVVGKNSQHQLIDEDSSIELGSAVIKVEKDHDYVTVSENREISSRIVDDNEIILGAKEQPALGEEIITVGGNGIRSELDNHGASHFTASSLGKSAGSMTTVTQYEKIDGLPRAIGTSTEVQALKLGPGAIAAAELLRHKDSKGTASEVYSFWNVTGFVLFFLAFFLTAFFTRDTIQGPHLPTGIKDPSLLEDDTDKAKEAWDRGESYYNDGKSMKKPGFSPNNGNDGAADDLYYSGMQPPSAGMNGNNDIGYAYDPGAQGGYDYNGVTSYGGQPAQSNPSSMAYSSSNSLDRKQGWQKPFYEQFNQQSSSSGFSSVSGDDDSFQYPQKSDFSKFVKPVNSDNHSVYTTSTSASSRAESLQSSSRSSISHESEYEDVVKPLKSSRPKFDYNEEMTMGSYSKGYDEASQYSGAQSQYSERDESDSHYTDDHTIATNDDYSQYSREYDDLKKPTKSLGDEPSVGTYQSEYDEPSVASSYQSYNDVVKPSYNQQEQYDEPSVASSYQSSHYNDVVKPSYNQSQDQYDEPSVASSYQSSHYNDVVKPSYDQSQEQYDDEPSVASSYQSSHYPVKPVDPYKQSQQQYADEYSVGVDSYRQ